MNKKSKTYFQIKRSTFIWVIVGFILFFSLYWSVDENNLFVEEGTIFIFKINETGNFIEGNLSFDGHYYGFSKEGKVFINPLNYFPSELVFEGIYEDIEFKFTYEFPKDYLEWSEIPFLIMEADLEFFDIEKRDNFFEIEEPHWGHMPLTYRISNDCMERQKNLTMLAFKKISLETDYIIQFKEISKVPDIEIKCKSQGSGSENAIADSIPYVDSYFISLIDHAEINIYGQGSICLTGYPALEVHEILHTFGFVHNSLTNSVMHTYSAKYSRKCGITKIDEQYVSCLKYIYSNGEIGKCVINNYNGDSPWLF